MAMERNWRRNQSFYLACQQLYCCAYFESITLDFGTDEERKENVVKVHYGLLHRSFWFYTFFFFFCLGLYKNKCLELSFVNFYYYKKVYAHLKNSQQNNRSMKSKSSFCSRPLVLFLRHNSLTGSYLFRTFSCTYGYLTLAQTTYTIMDLDLLNKQSVLLVPSQHINVYFILCSHYRIFHYVDEL